MNTTRWLVAVGAAGALMVPGTSAFAGGQEEAKVETAGTCSAGSVWKLEVKEDDGGIEVEFGVKSGTAGQVWNYTLTRDGQTVASGRATTGPRGGFSVERAVGTAAITDSFAGVATLSEPAETCDSTAGSTVLPGDDDGPGHHDGTDDTPGDDGPGHHDGTDDTPGDDGPGHHNGTDDTPGDDNSSDDSQQAGPIRDTGDCSATASWAVKVKIQGRTGKVKFGVDSERAGETWDYSISRDGDTVVSGSKRTRGSSGKFMVKTKMARAQAGTLTAEAENTDTGETCQAEVSL